MGYLEAKMGVLPWQQKKREIKQLIALFIFPKRTVDWGVFVYLEG